MDVILFGSTNAKTITSLGLVLGFLLLSLTVYYLIYGALSLVSLYGFKLKHRQRLAFSLSLISACLIALQSVGELSRRDAVVLVLLGLIAYLYTSYVAKNRQTNLL